MGKITEIYVVEIERDAQTQRVITETWRDEQGLMHRIDGPAHIEFDASGRIVCEQWNRHGHCHREDGLRADFAMNENNGVIFYEAWYENGYLHRIDDLPAEIQRCPDTGRTAIELWEIEGNTHRSDNKPALIEYGENGRIIRSEWYEHGRRHNATGPAVITYASDGGISSMEYYRCGQRFPALNSIKPKLGPVDKVDSQISRSVIQDCFLGGSFGSRRPDRYGMADHRGVVAHRTRQEVPTVAR